MTHDVKFGEAVQVDLSEFKAMYVLPMEIDGVSTGILIGKRATDMGIDVLTGADILKTLDQETDFDSKVRDAIVQCYKA